MKPTTLFCSAVLMLAANQASATTVTFDDVTVGTGPTDSYPTAIQGPIGFTDQGYQFSDNIVILNVSQDANGPAYSGDNAAFNDYYGYGYGPAFTITKVGGGDFSFSDVFVQSWSHSANDSVNVEIDGLLNGVYEGIIVVDDILTWTDISLTTPSAIVAVGSFADINELVITPSDYALIDNLTVNSVAATPLPGSLPLLGSVLALFSFVGWWRKRRRPAAMAMA
jgi:hypothetical protein